MNKFSIVIPVYNESGNILNLLNEIYQILFKKYELEILVVNDCSIDNTLNELNKFKFENFFIINNERNFGQSHSIHTGIEAAKNNNIITLDGDGQNNPADIPYLIECFMQKKEIDLVGGIRVKRKDIFLKKISSKFANFVRKLILKDDCDDTGCSLKIFKRDIFLKFPYFNGMHRFLPALFKGFGYKTFFIPVDHRKRKSGVSNYGTLDRLFKGIKDIIKVKKIIKNKND